MPYKSDKQRRFLHIHHPQLAKKWDSEYGSKPVNKDAVKRRMNANARRDKSAKRKSVSKKETEG